MRAIQADFKFVAAGLSKVVCFTLEIDLRIDGQLRIHD